MPILYSTKYWIIRFYTTPYKIASLHHKNWYENTRLSESIPWADHSYKGTNAWNSNLNKNKIINKWHLYQNIYSLLSNLNQLIY